MELEDYIDSEVGVAIAATAVVLSSRARDVLHRGAVYGVAGVLAAGDAVASFGRGIGRGWRGADRALPREVHDETRPPADGDAATSPAGASAEAGHDERA